MDGKANHLVTMTGARLDFTLYLLRVSGHPILVTFLSFKFNVEVRGFKKPTIANCFNLSGISVC